LAVVARGRLRVAAHIMPVQRPDMPMPDFVGHSKAAGAAGMPSVAVPAAGVNSEQFVMWCRYSRLHQAYGTSLAGKAKIAFEKERARERYRLTCVDASVAALVQGANSRAPRHMRSDVDRLVFGRDHDRSEGGAENIMLQRLAVNAGEDRPATALPRVDTPTGRLAVGQALGATRPSTVRPRPSSGGRVTHIMSVQRGTPEFQQELRVFHERQLRARNDRELRGGPAQGPIPGAFAYPGR